MRLGSRFPLAALLLVVGVACTGPSGEDTAAAVDPLCDDGHDLTWASWGEGYFATYCNACHAADTPNRFGAPESATFDSQAEVRQWAERIRVRVLDEGTMPLGGGVSEDDLYLLDVYLTCSL